MIQKIDDETFNFKVDEMELFAHFIDGELFLNLENSNTLKAQEIRLDKKQVAALGELIKNKQKVQL